MSAGEEIAKELDGIALARAEADKRASAVRAKMADLLRARVDEKTFLSDHFSEMVIGQVTDRRHAGWVMVTLRDKRNSTTCLFIGSQGRVKTEGCTFMENGVEQDAHLQTMQRWMVHHSHTTKLLGYDVLSRAVADTALVIDLRVSP